MDKCQNCGKEVIAGMSLCSGCQQHVRDLMAERRYIRHEAEIKEEAERTGNKVVNMDWEGK